MVKLIATFLLSNPQGGRRDFIALLARWRRCAPNKGKRVDTKGDELLKVAPGERSLLGGLGGTRYSNAAWWRAGVGVQLLKMSAIVEQAQLSS